MIVTTAMIKKPDGIILRVECLHHINMVFTLKAHMVKCPIAFLTSSIAIFKKEDKR
jgi:hypothetical protein